MPKSGKTDAYNFSLDRVSLRGYGLRTLGSFSLHPRARTEYACCNYLTASSSYQRVWDETVYAPPTAGAITPPFQYLSLISVLDFLFDVVLS